MTRSSIITMTAAAFLLCACADTLDRLEQVGKPPAMAQLENPTAKPGYQPITWPLPDNPAPAKRHANSLWQPGARAFFRDQRASRVGDILRVKIKIKDKAELDNQTSRSRATEEGLATPHIYGLEGKILKGIPGAADSGNLLELKGDSSNKGAGNIKRGETIETTIAALVTQILPNGNMVVEGKQEIRINYEVREIGIKGVVRPEDIDSDNTIDSTQVAEARITYGGRGQITDVQQPRPGNQVIDILSPF